MGQAIEPRNTPNFRTPTALTQRGRQHPVERHGKLGGSPARVPPSGRQGRNRQTPNPHLAAQLSFVAGRGRNPNRSATKTDAA